MDLLSPFYTFPNGASQRDYLVSGTLKKLTDIGEDRIWILRIERLYLSDEECWYAYVRLLYCYLY